MAEVGRSERLVPPPAVRRNTRQFHYTAHAVGAAGASRAGHAGLASNEPLQEKHVSITIPPLTTIAIEFTDGIAEIRLTRPELSNAMNEAMWKELRTAVNCADA